MGFLADIIRAITGIISQAVETEVKALCRIIKGLYHCLALMTFAILLMLLGAIFTVWGICSLLEPLVGNGLAAVIVGVIVILVGLVIICAANTCNHK